MIMIIIPFSSLLLSMKLNDAVVGDDNAEGVSRHVANDDYADDEEDAEDGNVAVVEMMMTTIRVRLMMRKRMIMRGGRGCYVPGGGC